MRNLTYKGSPRHVRFGLSGRLRGPVRVDMPTVCEAEVRLNSANEYRSVHQPRFGSAQISFFFLFSGRSASAMSASPVAMRYTE